MSLTNDPTMEGGLEYDIRELQEENRNLRESAEILKQKEADAVLEIQRLIAKADRTYCAYCGAEFPLDDDAAGMVSRHIMLCEKHPIRKLRRALSALLYACERADEAGELYETIDGSLLDAARTALETP